ncbi:MAG: DUF3224 domain-containing protein [Chloroflexi bacterium]|nr:MAG: DUF3224 domain-containing protein [Chloroflexota bacterium]
MTKHANGTFEVTMKPLDQGDSAQPENLGRMSLDKQFEGDLQASSKGQMLTALTSVAESAGYVAIEKVTGTLNGRSGTFTLQHNGLMSQGDQQLTIVVVPDSATGELAGLTGSMSIAIDENGKHTYEFNYTYLNV